MNMTFDGWVHDVKTIEIEREPDKGLIRIHVVDADGWRETVLRIWGKRGHMPEVALTPEDAAYAQDPV